MVDLTTGEILEKPMDAKITRSVAVSPSQDTDRYLAYLERRVPDRMARERLLVEMARSLVGVRLTKRVPWWIGPPGAFKSAYLSCFRRAIGDSALIGYGGVAPSAYMVHSTDRDSNKLNDQLGKLEGARVAFYDETPLSDGRVPTWSSRFVGELTDPESGATGRRIGGRSVLLRGMSFLCAANHLPELPIQGKEAILERLILFPWQETAKDAEEYVWLRSKEGQAQCLGAVLAMMPLALRLGDDLPVPPVCAAALQEYAATGFEE